MRKGREGRKLVDSLELLLDTMCNSFGGVIFIAIALTLVGTTTPELFLGSAERTQKETASLRREIRALEAASPPSLAPRPKTDPELDREIQEIVQETQRLAAENAAKERRVAALMDAAKSTKEEAETLTRRLSDLERREKDEAKQSKETQEAIAAIATQKAQIEKLEKELAKTETRTLSFPKLKATQKSPVIAILKDDRLYRVNEPGKALVAGPEKFQVSEDVLCKFNRLRNSLTFTLVKGMALAGPEYKEKRLERFLGKLDPEREFLWIMAERDSFSSLIALVARLRRDKSPFYWSPVATPSEYVLYLVPDANYRSY